MSNSPNSPQFLSTITVRVLGMKGLWVWPVNESEQKKLTDKIKSSSYFVSALSALAKNNEGLSNSQIDRTMKTNSQWNTRWIINELLGLGLMDYKVDPFGGPGKYTITDLGKSVLQNIMSPSQSAKPVGQHVTT